MEEDVKDDGIMTLDEFAKILYEDSIRFWDNVEKHCKEFEEKELPKILESLSDDQEK